MHLTNFGLLVKELRKNCYDCYGNKWTRESLSREIHLTPDQLGRLERGNRKYLDAQTLHLLAKAFNLTDLERKEFFYASTGLDDYELYNNQEPDEQLVNLIYTIQNLQFPAYIIDVYADIIAANKALLNLYQTTPEVIESLSQHPVGLNLVGFAYSSDLFKELLGSRWRKSAVMLLLEFRRSTLRYRHTEYFKFIFKNLLTEKNFDIDWYSSHRHEEHFDLTYEHIEYEHPLFGYLSYVATETIINTKAGALFLVNYNPADSDTLSIFNKLISNHGHKIHNLGSWPEKVII